MSTLLSAIFFLPENIFKINFLNFVTVLYLWKNSYKVGIRSGCIIHTQFQPHFKNILFGYLLGLVYFLFFEIMCI